MKKILTLFALIPAVCFAQTRMQNYPAAGALTGPEIVVSVQSGATKKVTADQIKTFTSASPSLVTPALGTPASGTLTNATGLPISTGVSGLGTSVATALAVNVGTAGSPVVNGGALGTPSSGTLTNATGLPATGVVGTALTLSGGTLTGPLLFTDNLYDIGASGATRPRTGYFGTSLLAPELDGSSAANGSLTLQGTTNGTRTTSYVLLQPNGGNVGVFAATPLTKFNVVDTVSTSPRGILSSQYSTDTSGARVGFAKARGTEASPSTVVTGDTLGRMMFRGYDGANFLEMASIETVSTGTIAATRVPTYMALSVATNAAPSVLTEQLRLSPGTVQLGSSDADTNAAVVAQTLRTQGLAAGGTSNQAGKDFTIVVSPGKGTSAGGSFIVQTAPAGSTGTALNAAAAALTIDSTKLATFAGKVIVPVGTSGALSIGGATNTATGIYITDVAVGFSANGVSEVSLADSNGLRLSAGRVFGWPSGAANAGAIEAGFSRISAGLIGVGTGAAGSFAGRVKLTSAIAAGVAIASLNASPTAGEVQSVTDSTSPTIGSAVAAGGSAFALVVWNGAQWTVIGK